MNRLLSICLPCFILLACGACGSEAKRKVETPAPAPAAVAKASYGLRLEHLVVEPKRYQATLRLDPGQSTFTGELEMALSVQVRSSDFYLNGYGLKVTSASIAVAGETIELNVAPKDEHGLHFTADRTLPLGLATLHVAYEGVVNSTSSFGIFRQESAGDWYLYTQFEARGARRAFPSVDQPDVKVPWQLSLEVPADLVALANTPEIGRELLGDGFVRVNFAESPPLPSYLVAFAVGAFDMVDIGKTRSNVPVRIAAPKGRGTETGWVKESTLSLIEILEDYTGIPYPYAKLDLVSVPSTGGFSAMENAGLITYTERLILSKDNDLSFKKNFASVGAHELAHQWFGNLVTNAWWNDLWLNESFATWAATKVVRKFNPEWRSDLSRIRSRDYAMDADKLASARVIHEPIKTEGDIGSAFDGITYSKGASVLAMFEGWMGEETFQRGIQHYLGNNQWKSLVAEDFLRAMDVGTKRNVAESFTTFIDNPGTPLVAFGLVCSEGASPTLTLSQERYKPLGSEISASPAYQIPLCVRYPTGVGVETSRACTMLSQKTSEMTLTAAKRCPKWIVPNDGATGYYRSLLSKPLLGALLKDSPLTTAETLAMASDLRALVWAGRAPFESMLALVAKMAGSKDDGLVSTAAEMASLEFVVRKEDERRYRRWLVKHFGTTAKTLGWKPKAGEASSRTALRETLLELMIFEGGDAKLRAEGQALAKAWLANPGSVDANIASMALRVGARFGSRELLDRYIAAIKGTSDRSRRRLLFAGLGAVREPARVEHVLKAMLDPGFALREAQRTFESLAEAKDSGHLALTFVEANFDALIQIHGEGMGARLASIAASQCDEAVTDSVEEFLEKKVAPVYGGARASEQALETFRLCLAAKETLRLPAKL